MAMSFCAWSTCARSAQPVEVDLSEFKGAVPIELVGRTPFPPVGDLPYLLTLPGYGFYWFQLSKEEQPPSWHDERLQRDDLPFLVLFDGWTSFFPERVANWRMGLATKLREQLETIVVPKYIASQRWYAGKGAPIKRAQLGDNGEWETEHGRWLAGVFEVESQAEKALYFLPFAIAYEDTDEGRWQKLQHGAIARVRRQATVGVLADATSDENFCRSVVEGIGSGADIKTERGIVRLSATQMYSQLRGDPASLRTISQTAGQSSNTTVRVGEMFFLKFYRRLQSGINPELEIGRYLTEVVRFPNIVPVAGTAEYIDNADGTSRDIGASPGLRDESGRWLGLHSCQLSRSIPRGSGALTLQWQRMRTVLIWSWSRRSPRARRSCTAHWQRRPQTRRSRRSTDPARGCLRHGC